MGHFWGAACGGIFKSIFDAISIITCRCRQQYSGLTRTLGATQQRFEEGPVVSVSVSAERNIRETKRKLNDLILCARAAS